MSRFNGYRASLAGVLLGTLAGFHLAGPAGAQIFDKTPNAAISGNNVKQLSNVSPEDCMRACESASDFKCVSFDYHKNANKCDLSDKTAADVGGLKRDYPGNPYDHYALEEIIEKEASPYPKSANFNYPKSRSFPVVTPNVDAAVSAISGTDAKVIDTHLRGFVEKYGSGTTIADHVQGITMTASGRIVLSISRTREGYGGCGGVLAYSSPYNPEANNNLTWNFYCGELDDHPSSIQAAGEIIAVGSFPGAKFFHLPDSGPIEFLPHLTISGGRGAIGFTYDPRTDQYWTLLSGGSITPKSTGTKICVSRAGVSPFDASTKLDDTCYDRTHYASAQGANLLMDSSGRKFIASLFSTNSFWPDDRPDMTEKQKAAYYVTECIGGSTIGIFNPNKSVPYEDVAVLTEIDLTGQSPTLPSQFNAGRTQRVQTCVHDRPAFRFAGGVATLKNDQTYALWSGRFLSALPAGNVTEAEMTANNNDSFEFAIQRLPATSKKELTYAVGIDCQTDGIDNEGTTSTITATFYDKTGKQVGIGAVTGISDGITGCMRIRDVEIEAKTTGEVETVKVSTNGSDAFMIDRIHLYREGEKIQSYGANNDRGWCLSTDPKDGTGSWSYAANGICVTHHTWSYSGASVPNNPYDIALANAGSQAMTTWGVDVDCDVSGGVSNEHTSGKLAVSFLKANGELLAMRNLGGGEDGPLGCTDLEAEMTVRGDAKIVKFTTDSSDAAMLDEITILKNGQSIKVIGDSDDRGWCLSTDPDDANGNWKGHIEGGVCKTAVQWTF